MKENTHNNLDQLLKIANSWLRPEEYNDYCVNGLQVENSGKCSKIVAAVSASLSAIEAAAEVNADVLLVHHGVFWHKEPMSLANYTYKRVQALIKNDIALVAYHLPLDEHELYGNNFLLGQALGIDSDSQKHLMLMQPSLGRYADISIGAQDLRVNLERIMARESMHLAFGPEQIAKIAWCTGAAQDGIIAAYNIGAQAYISGEVSERTYHLAKELGLHYYAVGHHASERFGVKALAFALSDHLGIEHQYLELPNPI